MSFKFSAKDTGTSGIGVVPTVTITSGKTTTATNLGYIIGHADSKTISTADDGAFGTGHILTITADTAGSVLSEVGLPAAATSLAVKSVAIGSAAGAVVELVSTYKPNSVASAATTTTQGYVTQSRSDVTNPEEGNAAAASNSVTVNFSRVAWL